MIDAATAREIGEELGRVEERLGRLLVSGWRQADSEAAELAREADALAELGLDGIAARVRAVAAATGAAEALRAIALATSACRLLRGRLLTSTVPEGWAPLVPPKRSSRPGTDTLLPVSRMLLDGREVWACVWMARIRCVLIEQPFPPDEQAAEAVDVAQASAEGLFGKLKRRVGLASEPAEPASSWLNHRLRGTLEWRVRYPLGADGDVTSCVLHRAEWVEEPDEHDQLRGFRHLLATNTLEDGTPLFWTAGGFRVVALKRGDSAGYAWFDPCGPALLSSALDTTVLALAWTDGSAVMPVAFLAPGYGGRPARIVHLLPGGPSEIISTAIGSLPSGARP
jgi:hypothetical protein